ncbi:hypothetical protein KY343_02745 [Candidatus Woesearchaeota archaeon]|nr:hypothetical protein [Candidatus Woesearchaeota archaeon]
MPDPKDAVVNELMRKYKAKLAEHLELEEPISRPVFSREYKQFKKEYLPKRLTFYEKACNFSEKILKISAGPKKTPLLQEAINISHLDITPVGATSFSIFAPLCVILLGSVASFLIFNSMFFVVFFLLAGVIMISPLSNLPFFIANNWRMKASNQMVLCVFYIVTFMRHTSNLELAIRFAADHLDPPLSLDFKKVLWDIETEKYESIKESLDMYLETWRKWNMEFIESFHLIESSLYEPSEDRRLALLDKSLDVILSETYEKMLHYAHNLKSPITMLHMLGVILPILGLVILPLVVNFMGDVKWYHLAMLYDVTLPVGVYLLGKKILSQRPTGYGDTDTSETNPTLKKYKNIIINLAGLEIQINPLILSILIGFVFMLIGFSPIIFHSLNMPDIGIGRVDETSPCGKIFCFMEYRESTAEATLGEIVGPYGLGAALVSLLIILGIGIPIGLYFRLRSKNIIKIRENSKKLEGEFASALFQLGNRLGDGLPAEISFGKVAEVMKDTVSGAFFDLVNSNIKRLGMSVKDAIFDPKTGALVHFPSRIIESSMKVLIQSIKKGPLIAAQALMNIARYIKEIHKVNERLKDLMADIISSMQSQIKFLAPTIAGIVIGITSMVTTILGKLSAQLNQLSAAGEGTTTGMGVIELFGDGIPTYHFQIMVGIYVVQIIYILTVMSNGIENGADSLAEKYFLGQNLIRSTAMYCGVAAIIMILFNIIASQILTALA